jgi:hypothetical protein
MQVSALNLSGHSGTGRPEVSDEEYEAVGAARIAGRLKAPISGPAECTPAQCKMQCQKGVLR